MQAKDPNSMEVSPYLRRPLRSLEEVLAARAARQHQSFLEIGLSKANGNGKGNGHAVPALTPATATRN